MFLRKKLCVQFLKLCAEVRIPGLWWNVIRYECGCFFLILKLRTANCFFSIWKLFLFQKTAFFRLFHFHGLGRWLIFCSSRSLFMVFFDVFTSYFFVSSFLHFTVVSNWCLRHIFVMKSVISMHLRHCRANLEASCQHLCWETVDFQVLVAFKEAWKVPGSMKLQHVSLFKSDKQVTKNKHCVFTVALCLEKENRKCFSQRTSIEGSVCLSSAFGFWWRVSVGIRKQRRERERERSARWLSAWIIYVFINKQFVRREKKKRERERETATWRRGQELCWQLGITRVNCRLSPCRKRRVIPSLPIEAAAVICTNSLWIISYHK